MNITRIPAIVLLILLPYSTILSRFSPYLSKYTFSHFLLASLAFAVVSITLGLLIRYKKDKPASLMTGGSLFVLLGLLVAPPLMLGPPEVTAALLQRSGEEHFRYGMLLVAILVFGAGFILTIRSLWSNLHPFHKGILLPFAGALVAGLWDNYSSYQFSAELSAWTAAGKNADAFFTEYDFNVVARTSGRCLLYVTSLWLSLILFKAGWIRKWVFITLAIFSGIGIIFFAALLITGDGTFYFLLIPAIALAPAYWTGIALISGKPNG